MARFPSVFEPASVTLSVVVPAYNEEERMPPGVDEMLGHLKKMEKSPFWCASPLSAESAPHPSACASVCATSCRAATARAATHRLRPPPPSPTPTPRAARPPRATPRPAARRARAPP